MGNHFIDQDNIRAIKREGKGTRIDLIKGGDIFVEVEYDKIKPLIPSK